MVSTQRRRAPRMTVKEPAYVNLDSDNGGIVLNVSEGGLCFESTAPVDRTETIRLWFSYGRQRVGAAVGQAWKDQPQTEVVSRFIETGSELAWADETRKRGGLKFTNLSAEAREQIRDWIAEHAPVGGTDEPEFPFASLRKSTIFNLTGSFTNPEQSASTRLDVPFRHVQSRSLWTVFSVGLVAGVLVSALVVGVYALVNHSRELGDFLIQVGERFGGRSRSEPISPAVVANSATSTLPEPRSPESATQPQAVSAQAQTAAPARPQTGLPAQSQADAPTRAQSVAPTPPSESISMQSQLTAPAPTQTPAPEKLLSTATPPSTAAKPPIEPETTSVVAAASFLSPHVKDSDGPAASAIAGNPSVPESTAAPTSAPGENTPRPTAPKMEFESRPIAQVEPSKVQGVEMRSEKYLEVGKFKEKLLADKTTRQLSKLGYSATVIEWNKFFGRSYRVLTGPYGSEPDAESAHKSLASLGFTPRSYERGKRDFSLPPALRVGTTRLPVGYCVISWESYIPEAIVKIQDERGNNVTVEGKWVKQDSKYGENAVAYVKNRDGSRTLIEIRFAGMAQTLVFPRGTN